MLVFSRDIYSPATTPTVHYQLCIRSGPRRVPVLLKEGLTLASTAGAPLHANHALSFSPLPLAKRLFRRSVRFFFHVATFDREYDPVKEDRSPDAPRPLFSSAKRISRSTSCPYRTPPDWKLRLEWMVFFFLIFMISIRRRTRQLTNTGLLLLLYIYFWMVVEENVAIIFCLDATSTLDQRCT